MSSPSDKASSSRPMEPVIDPNFTDMLRLLYTAKIEYVIVGAFALGIHGIVRNSGDIDIFIRGSKENAEKMYAVLKEFGAPLHDLTVDDLANPSVVYQIGLPPSRIDIMSSISGVDFDAAFANRITIPLMDFEVSVMGRKELIKNKEASGRPKDLLDLDLLRKLPDA